MPEKQCSKCKEVKPVGEFYKTRDGKYGVAGHCKICMVK